MRHGPRSLWLPRVDRLRECIHRIEVAANTSVGDQGSWSDGRPYRFNAEWLFFDAVNVTVKFKHQDDDHLRYSVRIEENTIARRPVAIGPTGLIDVRGGLGAGLGDIDVAFDKIIAFLDSRVKIIMRSDPVRPLSLTDVIAGFRRLLPVSPA